MPIVLTEFGMVIDWSDEHCSNKQLPIVVTELGMVTDWSDEQFQNAYSPIVVTEYGMVTDWSEVHPLKVPTSIDVFPGLGKASIYLYFFSLSS